MALLVYLAAALLLVVPSVFAAPAARTPASLGNTTTACMLCETIVVGIELELTSYPNITAQEVVADLYRLCNVSFLAKYKEECMLLVDAEGVEVVKEIFAGTSGFTICSNLVPPLCSSSATAQKFYSHASRARRSLRLSR